MSCNCVTGNSRSACGGLCSIGKYCVCNNHYRTTSRTTSLFGKQYVNCISHCYSTNCRCVDIGNFIGPVNAEFSEDRQINDKNKTVEEGSASISKFITFFDTDIFTTPTAEDLQKYFNSLENSKLTKSQQRLLLEQITVGFIETNVLNTYPNVRNVLNKKNKSINKEAIHKQINETIKTVVENIVLKSDYKEPFLQFNYANAFQALFYHVSLKLYRYKWDIIRNVYTTVAKN